MKYKFNIQVGIPIANGVSSLFSVAVDPQFCAKETIVKTPGVNPLYMAGRQ
jgi:hypothetical protein